MSLTAFTLTTETILASLLDAHGTAYDADTGSTIYCELEAYAMAIASAWDTGRRLACQFDPLRMSDFLPRWEKIFGLRPRVEDSAVDRRRMVARKFVQIGQMPNASAITDLLNDILPSTFVGLVYTASGDAEVHVPLGATIPGGITAAAGDWASSVAFLAIETDQPATMTDAEYRSEVGTTYAWLEDALPAWVEYGEFLDGAGGIGFFLDEERNLDGQRFD
jgi:hypothetical protein